MQDVFVRLLATVPPAELESESDVLKYLSAAVENRLRDLNRFHKRGKRAHAREESLPDDVSDLDVRALAPTPSQITMGREKYERYLEVVQALPDRQREAVILARHLLYPAATCARLLGMNSPAAFRTLLARALARTTLRMNES
ncbi:MAG: sigma-70 family RNA polymerase sigma factor [Planctomycetes bacterium]|nr:sigma-70 family RNA polymerase sigma factor [Planctomycetota bacterium]